MRKWRISLIVIAMLAMALTAMRMLMQEPLYHTQSYVFGTLVDISIYGEPEDRAKLLANQVLLNFQNLHNQLHAWKPVSSNQPSELGALNTAFANGNKPITISPQLAAMLTDATDLSVKSQGLFNPAIGHLVSLWGFQRDEFTAVKIDDAKIKAQVKANPRMSDIVLKDNTAYSTNPNVKLDLGGYAKGYALDMAADYLRKQQVKNALVNIGGNIIALGQHGDKPWRVGIQHPRKPAAIATLDLADGWAIGTSGDYQRYFMLDGKRYCHIIDPRSGYPVQHTQAVTVLIPPQSNAGVMSDVASKPIFIAVAEDKAKTAAMLGIQYFMVIDQQSNILVSSALSHKLEWLDPEVKKNSHVKLVTLP
ncbi:MAG TPA: FAD:protein FMN transferase [Methylotenera sp.]